MKGQNNPCANKLRVPRSLRLKNDLLCCFRHCWSNSFFRFLLLWCLCSHIFYILGILWTIFLQIKILLFFSCTERKTDLVAIVTAKVNYDQENADTFATGRPKDTKVNFLVRSFFCIYSFSKIIRSRYGDGGNYFRKASQIIKINSVLTFLDVLAHLHLPLSLVFSTDTLYFSLYFVIHSDWVSLSEKTLDCYFLSGSEQQIPFCFSFCF